MKKPAFFDGVALPLTVQIVSAYVSNNNVEQEDLPRLLHDIHEAICKIGNDARIPAAGMKPAVPVAKSITKDHIVCLEDGKKLRMLKRYIRTHFDLSPDEYRRKWALPADYPMVAPGYSKKRSALAKKSGLGKKLSEPVAAKSTRGAKKRKKSAAPTPRMLAETHQGRRILPAA